MNYDNNATTLAGFEEPHSDEADLSGFGPYWSQPIGFVEKGVRAQVSALREQGLIEAVHEGAVALALSSARDLDRSAGKGAPSGRANLLRAMKEVLEFLPSPEIAGGDSVDAIVKALESMPDEPVPAEYAGL